MNPERRERLIVIAEDIKIMQSRLLRIEKEERAAIDGTPVKASKRAKLIEKNADSVASARRCMGAALVSLRRIWQQEANQ